MKSKPKIANKILVLLDLPGGKLLILAAVIFWFVFFVGSGKGAIDSRGVVGGELIWELVGGRSGIN